MTDEPKIPHPTPLDARGIFIMDLLETNERLERENVELRRDREALRVTLQASCDLNHKYHGENLKLRSYAKQLRSSAVERRAA